MLEKEFQYYITNQNELVKKYNGKFIVIVADTVIGAYDTQLDAYLKAKAQYQPGTFLIQKCAPGKESYTQTFNSRRLAFV